ncbi:MAG: cell division protein FtsX [Alphaproteobacteria bacterium]
MISKLPVEEKGAVNTLEVLPFDYTNQSKMLPWLMAAMLFLAALSLASVFATHNALSTWDKDIKGTLLVQVLPDNESTTETRTQKVLQILKKDSVVKSFTLADHKENMALLEPWFGDKDMLSKLPIPRIIDIKIVQDAQQEINLSPLKKKLKRIPSVLVSDNKPWLSDLKKFARSVLGIALSSFVVIFAIAALAVILATRTSLAINQQIITMLYLLGAENEYISKQVETYTLRHSLLGGGLGVLSSGVTIFFLKTMAPNLNGLFLPAISLKVYQWILIAIIPFLGLGIAIATARISILYRLIKEDPYR